VRELKGVYDQEAMTEIVERELAALDRGSVAVSREQVRLALSAKNFVAVRCIPGGPASEALEPEILRAREQSAEDKLWLTETEQRLAQAQTLMRQESDSLLRHADGH
jgi:argininosuccinate lyase